MVARCPLVFWFLVGCGLVIVTQAGYLFSHNWDLTTLLQVGCESPARQHLEHELGPLTFVAGLGHDGKYFYLMARRPWVCQADPETLRGLEDPGYRYGRPLYPVLAGLGGLLPPQATLVGLALVQVLSGGLLVVVLVLLARHNGLPTLAVLIGLANPAIYSSAVLLTSDLLASALVLAGILFWQHGRVRASLVFFALALLAKEYYALTPLTLAGFQFVQGRRWASLAVGVVPLLPLLGWKLIVLNAVGMGGGGGNFSWPGMGIWAAAPGWQDCDPLAGLAVVLVILGLAAVARASAPLPRWQCVAWGLLGVTASRIVWADPADLLRVVSPLWWCVVWCWYPVPQRNLVANAPSSPALTAS